MDKNKILETIEKARKHNCKYLAVYSGGNLTYVHGSTVGEAVKDFNSCWNAQYEWTGDELIDKLRN